MRHSFHALIVGGHAATLRPEEALQSALAVGGARRRAKVGGADAHESHGERVLGVAVLAREQPLREGLDVGRRAHEARRRGATRAHFEPRCLQLFKWGDNCKDIIFFWSERI